MFAFVSLWSFPKMVLQKERLILAGARDTAIFGVPAALPEVPGEGVWVVENIPKLLVLLNKISRCIYLVDDR
jgi:hypothetical protein